MALSETERNRARALASKLSMPILTRLWQMLLKGVNEVRYAPSPLSALEMLLVRIAYASELPTPGEVIRQLGKEPKEAMSAAPVMQASSALAPSMSAPVSRSSAQLAAAPMQAMEPVMAAKPTLQLVTNHQPVGMIQLETFEQAVALFDEKRETAALYAFAA